MVVPHVPQDDDRPDAGTLEERTGRMGQEIAQGTARAVEEAKESDDLPLLGFYMMRVQARLNDLAPTEYQVMMLLVKAGSVYRSRPSESSGILRGFAHFYEEHLGAAAAAFYTASAALLCEARETPRSGPGDSRALESTMASDRGRADAYAAAAEMRKLATLIEPDQVKRSYFQEHLEALQAERMEYLTRWDGGPNRP